VASTGSSCEKRGMSNNKTPDPHPSIMSLLVQFEFEHLPDHLREVSQPFSDLAYRMVESHADQGLELDGPELTVSLRLLVQSKDCAVRARLAQDMPGAVAGARVRAALDRRAEQRESRRMFLRVGVDPADAG
jgi:hypothetical protein